MLWTIFVILMIMWLLGISKRIYDRRIHSYPAGYRNCRCFDQNYSRAKPFVILTAKIFNAIIIRKPLNLDKYSLRKKQGGI